MNGSSQSPVPNLLPNILFLVFVSGVLTGPTKVPLHSVLLARSCDFLLSPRRVLPPGRPGPGAGAEASGRRALCPCCPSGWLGPPWPPRGAAVVLSEQVSCLPHRGAKALGGS